MYDSLRLSQSVREVGSQNNYIFICQYCGEIPISEATDYYDGDEYKSWTYWYHDLKEDDREFSACDGYVIRTTEIGYLEECVKEVCMIASDDLAPRHFIK
jgi:hypothetical protein